MGEDFIVFARHYRTNSEDRLHIDTMDENISAKVTNDKNAVLCCGTTYIVCRIASI